MYTIATNIELIKKARRVCSSDMKQLEKLLKEEYGISAQVSLVGSAKKKLITFNGKNKTFDLKKHVREAFNKIIHDNGLSDVENSTSSLTSKPMIFDNDPTQTPFHIDLAIITDKNGYTHRLIYDKHNHKMFWNQVAKISTLKHKE